MSVVESRRKARVSCSGAEFPTGANAARLTCPSSIWCKVPTTGAPQPAWRYAARWTCHPVALVLVASQLARRCQVDKPIQQLVLGPPHLPILWPLKSMQLRLKRQGVRQ